MVNINLFNIKIYNVETFQFLIYLHADSQASWPIKKAVQIQETNMVNINTEAITKKQKTKEKYRK